ncbi:MAG TPA: helix-turn-helix domain-containing protein [Candidatus Sphingobacterium stercoripullorum]|nr:helix-turn-helix domain-containing protein [Candidatus Sphingobacterium stercoripullorum]
MSNFSRNLKFLRKKYGLTQQKLADMLKVTRAAVGSYEEGRSKPKFSLLTEMSEFFEVTVTELMNEKINAHWKPKATYATKKLRILTVAVGVDNSPKVNYVSALAQKQYASEHYDTEYVSTLPQFTFLDLDPRKVYRAFEIKDSAMLPINQEDVVIGEYLEDWSLINPNETYIVVVKEEGVEYRRVGRKIREPKGLQLLADNPAFESFWVPTSEIVEIWKPYSFISKSFPVKSDETELARLSQIMAQMQKSIDTVIHNK